MRKLTKTQAYKALKTQYGKDCLEDYTIEDLQDETRFRADDSTFYTIDESNYKEWLLCDYFDAVEGDPESKKTKAKVKSKFLEINPNAASGTWLFWEVPKKSKVNKTIKVGDRFFIYEYQCGIGEDFSIEIR